MQNEVAIAELNARLAVALGHDSLTELTSDIANIGDDAAKRAQREVKAKERCQKAIQKVSDGHNHPGIVSLSLEGTVVALNEVARNWLATFQGNRIVQDAVGHIFVRLVVDQCAAAVQAAITAAIQGESCEVPFSMLSVDGECEVTVTATVKPRLSSEIGEGVSSKNAADMMLKKLFDEFDSDEDGYIDDIAISKLILQLYASKGSGKLHRDWKFTLVSSVQCSVKDFSDSEHHMELNISQLGGMLQGEPWDDLFLGRPPPDPLAMGRGSKHSSKKDTTAAGTQAAFGVVGVDIICKDMTKILYEASLWIRVLHRGFAKQPLIVLDLNAIVTFGNCSALEALGFKEPAEQAIGVNIVELVSNRARDVIKTVIGDVICDARELHLPLYNVEVAQQTSATRQAPLSFMWLASPYFSMTGKVLGAILQLQAHPVLALTVDASNLSANFPILQESQFVHGVFREHLEGIALTDILGQEIVTSIASTLTNSMELELEVDFASWEVNKSLHWQLCAEWASTSNDEQEVVILMQILEA